MSAWAPWLETIAGGNLTTPQGYLAGAVAAGIKTKAGALDLCLLLSEGPCATAGLFTRNQVKGAPVILSQQRVAGGRVRALIANAGCANAITGEAGYADAVEMTVLAAKKLGVAPEEVVVCSTGVTGVRLPMEKLRAGIPRIALSPEGGPALARAIMTTDTRPKEIAVGVGRRFAVGGCAKGSGMIHPDMATMFSFVTTDAAIEPGFLRAVQREVADQTLNMVSVDGDTSCSDTFLLFANGAAGGPPISSASAEAAEFRDALLVVCTHLARELARDGEGAKRLMEVVVTGAASKEDAVRVARTITNSPLVKTAVAGCDPNWGRVLVAAGRAGAALDEAKASLRLQGELLFERGLGLAFEEKAVSDKLDADEVRIELDLGLGDGVATAWGCDLTADYVHINADYRT